MYINSQLLFAILSLLGRHSTFVTDRLYNTDGHKDNILDNHLYQKIHVPIELRSE